MIRQNQRFFNALNVLTDGLILLLSLPVAFWLRFAVLPGGIATVPLTEYLWTNFWLTAIQLLLFAAFGLYNSFRHTRLRHELARLWQACCIGLALLFSWLFIGYGTHYSRLTWGIFFALSVFVLSLKRILLRTALRRFRQEGYNQKFVLLLGSGPLARRYYNELAADPALGYQVAGYLAAGQGELPFELQWLGSLDDLDSVLEELAPDEVVSALELDEFDRTVQVIAACDKAGVRLSIIPAFARFVPGQPQFDDLNGIPLMNVRRVPLDNILNAFFKRTMDVVCSALMLLVLSPVMLLCAIGVRLSSPGPVIFKQERLGRNKVPFYMYKFRSMRCNDAQDSAWSTLQDSRRTPFGSFLRKCSLDELPQLWNVLRGDMSLVGPRPELPHFVEQFKEDVPLYMVKHQVRPGITGWAQVRGFRGDTSIRGRIECDIYYIEHWSPLFDIQILFMTLFGGKFLNAEELALSGKSGGDAS